MPGLFGWLSRDSSGESHDTTPADVQQRLADGEKLYLLDVREPHEFKEAHVPGSVLVSLGNLSTKMSTLPKDKPIVVICRSGNRSGAATNMLKRAGFPQVQNMKGGIIAWARTGAALKRGG